MLYNKSIKEGEVAKLKLLGGLFGNIRAYGRLVPGEVDPREQLLCFDIVIDKSHSM